MKLSKAKALLRVFREFGMYLDSAQQIEGGEGVLLSGAINGMNRIVKGYSLLEICKLQSKWTARRELKNYWGDRRRAIEEEKGKEKCSTKKD
jgi:hypothetical protein